MLREDAFGPDNYELKEKIDFIFDTSSLRGTTTTVMAIELIKKHFPQKKILLLGIDGPRFGGWSRSENNHFEPIHNDKTTQDYYQTLVRQNEELSSIFNTVDKQKGVYVCNWDANIPVFVKISIIESLDLVSAQEELIYS